MDLDFFYRSLRVALWVTLLVAFGGWLLAGPVWAAQYAFFGLWAVANLFCLARLLLRFISEKKLGVALAWLAANMAMVALLVVAVGLVAKGKSLSVSAFLIGFHTPLAVILLKALGALHTQGKQEQKKSTITEEQNQALNDSSKS